MGMYDYIICKAPIAGGLPAWIEKYPFQTKDLDCSLTSYTISEDGTFSEPDFSGTLDFYSNNIVGVGPGVYTENGENAESIDCKAIFLHGKLTEPIQAHRESEPAWPSSRHFSPNINIPQRTDEEQQQRYDESMVGKRIYILWGGQDKGYWSKVVAENNREICASRETESALEIIDRCFRDHIFWDSEEEALSRRLAQKTSWDNERKAFEEYQKSKEVKHE